MTDVQLFIDADATPVNQRSSVYTWDDFRNPGGVLNWQTTLVGSGSVSGTTGTADHPGVTQLANGGASGSSAALTLETWESRLQTLEWVFSPGNNATVSYLIGAFDSTTPTEGVGIAFDTSLTDTALSLVKYVASTRTVGATLALTTGHWYRMNWSRSGSGAGTLTLNDLDAATSQSYSVSGLTAGQKWFSLVFCKGLAAAGRTLNVDWFLDSMVGMAR